MEYEVKKICAFEELKLEPIASQLLKKYLRKCYDIQDILAVCFNMAVCYFCVVDKKGKRIFKSPFEVAKRLTLEEIAQVSSKAQGNLQDNSSEYEEWGVNESFGEN